MRGAISRRSAKRQGRRERERTSVSVLPARGELWWCELPDVGRRPVVVLSRDAAIPRLRRTLVAPCTTTIRGIASEVVIEPDSDPIPQRSAVNMDSVESVSISVLVERLGRLGGVRMREVCAALEVATDCGR
jgi:mRNA interferase MazF